MWRLLGRLVGSLLNVSVCCLWVCVGCLGDCFECLSMGLHGPLSVSVAYSGHSPKLQAHPHKHIPIHSTSYRRLDYIPKRVSQATGTPHKKHTDTFHKLPTTRLHPEKGTIKNKPRPLNELPTHCTSFSALAPVVFPWVSLVFPGPLWEYLAFSSLLLAYMGLYGPLWASLAVSAQSPKLPTHTHKKHTETFHKLPTNKLPKQCTSFSVLVGSLWNVSVCFYRCVSGA